MAIQPEDVDTQQPQCPVCNATDCEMHLLLDVDPGDVLVDGPLVFDHPSVVARIADELVRVAGSKDDVVPQGSAALIEALDMMAELIEEESDPDPVVLESHVAMYFVDLAREVDECIVEEHEFLGDSPASGSCFFRIYAREAALATRAIIAAAERDLKALSQVR